MSEAWTSPLESSPTTASETYERQLALVDRMLGLEAQLAEVSVDFDLTPDHQLRVEQQLDRMRSSLAWRVGRIATAPLTVARRRWTRDR